MREDVVDAASLKQMIIAQVKVSLAAKPGTPGVDVKIGDDGLVTTEPSADPPLPLVDANGDPVVMDPEVLDALADGIANAMVLWLAKVTVITQVNVGGVTPGPGAATGAGVGTIQ